MRNRLLLSALCLLLQASLSSCFFNREKADATYPTVAEMDALDLQWGLPKRKTKGGPRRMFQYYEPKSGGAAGTPVPSMISPEPPAPAPAASPAPSAASGRSPIPPQPIPSALR